MAKRKEDEYWFNDRSYMNGMATNQNWGLNYSPDLAEEETGYTEPGFEYTGYGKPYATTGRDKYITGQGGDVYRRGEALDIGPVGNNVVVDPDKGNTGGNALSGAVYTPASSGYYSLGDAPVYGGSWWDTKADELGRQYVGMNYEDWTNGDAYRSLADRYSKNGQSAMLDTLAQIAGRTGGIASSYASAAAAQQYDKYMQALEDAAFGRYSDEKSLIKSDLDTARGMASDLYSRWVDEQNRKLANMKSYSKGAYYTLPDGTQMDAATYNKLLGAADSTPDSATAGLTKDKSKTYTSSPIYQVDPDEGITRYNGKDYSDITQLAKDVVASQNQGDIAALEAYFNSFPDATQSAIKKQIEQIYPNFFA